jgi:hypothetical protein
MMRTACRLLFAVVALCPSLAAAQGRTGPSGPSAPAPAPTSPRQVISGNPFGLLLDLVNAEYEVRAAPAVTVGAGASRANWGMGNGESYVNGDVFVRYFPGGQVFSGRSFGVKAGMTRLPSSGTYFGVGFDANQTWMLNRHFAFSTGLGLKRLIGADDYGPRIIPTLRVNVGVGF